MIKFLASLRSNLRRKVSLVSYMELGPTNKSRKRKAMFEPSETTGKIAKGKMEEVVKEFNISAEKLGVTILQCPTKSESDKKEYLVMQLENGLTALLISDVENLITLDEENTEAVGNEVEEGSSEEESSTEGSEEEDDDGEKEKLAACSLTVGVGSFSDPEEVPGLAHFLEHMLFMGSTKYPEENEFESFISSNGGYSNAETECEYTTYFFNIPEIYLKEGMDRFSHFFISPLLRRESMVREREAIESEFKLNMLMDSLRREQLFCSTAPQNNPAHKFMWGNLISLQENVTEDVLYESLSAFWSRHYSAHRMTLAVQARLPLELLAIYVVECFSGIRNNQLHPDPFPYVEPPFDLEKFHQYYVVEPVKDICKLSLTWAFPPVLHLYKYKPLDYLSHLIGHEGEGSISAYLRRKLWALTLQAGNSTDGLESNTMYSLFTIEIDLTEDGVKEITKLLKIIFGYIKLLKETGPQESVYNEMKLLHDTEFRYESETDADDNVEDLSQNMLFFPPEDYITGDTLLFEYNPDIITVILSKITPESVNIMLSSKEQARKFQLDQMEPWFGTKYTTMDKPQFQNLITDLQNTETDPYFKLPKPNPYITTDFTLLPSKNNMPEYPEKIVDDDRIELWYKQDITFKLPHAYTRICLITPLITEAKHAAMMDIFACIFSQLIVEEIYPATLAGFSFSIAGMEKGLLITGNGFNQKLNLLINTILYNITLFNEKVHQGIFDVMKKELSKNYFNATTKPTKLGNELRLGILVHPFFSSISKHKALPSITMIDLKTFVESFLKNLYVQSLVQGNMSKKEAIEMSDNIKNTLNFNPIGKESLPRIQVRQLPAGERWCRVENVIPDVNCDVTNYYQFGPGDIEECCKLELLIQIMEEPFFDTLRTKEQLGYAVNCTFRDTFGVLGFSLTVLSQADKHSVDHVEGRITNFVKELDQKLKSMPKEEFAKAKESVKRHKQEVDSHLKQEMVRNWSEILTMQYKFDRRKKEVKYIETLKMKDIYNFYRKLVDEASNEFCLRKLSVQVDGNALLCKSSIQNLIPDGLKVNEIADDKQLSSLDHNSPLEIQTLPLGGKFIADLEEFKFGLKTYPASKTHW